MTSYAVVMSEPDISGDEAEEAEDEHPLKAGIDAASEGDTASIEDIFSSLEQE